MSKKSPDLPRLLAFDLDGTLLPESKEITPYTRGVIDSLRELGCSVTVATGKFHHLALQYGEQLELDLPQISHDGAIVGGNGHSPVHRCIPIATASALVETYQSVAVHAFADDGKDVMLLRGANEVFQAATKNWAVHFGHVDDLAGHLQDDSAILTFYGEDEAIQEIHRDALAKYPDLRISLYWSEYLGCRRITFQPRGIDKGSGVLEVALKLGIDASECMVFGDWHNDLSMFRIGAVSVAMANAVPEVRAAAGHETELSNEEDGVARFLEQHFLR